MRKVLSFIFGVLAFMSFIIGFILQVSNAQGEKIPDGHPLESALLIWILFFIVPAVFVILIGVMRTERKTEKHEGLYLNLKKHLDLISLEKSKPL